MKSRLALFLAAALSAMRLWAADVEAVHPLVFGDLGVSAHPFWQAVNAQADALAQLGPGASASDIDAELTKLSAQGPAARLAAAAIARERVEPGALAPALATMPDQGRAAAIAQALARLPAPRDDPASPSLALLEHAGGESALSRLFDGARAPADIGLSDLHMSGGSLKAGRQTIKALGRGEFGVVFPHPHAEGAVLKAVDHSFEVLLFTTQTPKATADEEERTARALAEIGAGPRFLGRATLRGRPISARERVYGDTLDALIARRAYGPAEHALVVALIGRLAKAGIALDDLRPANVMIGRTLLDRERRAYVLDGGKLSSTAGRTDDQRFAEIYGRDTLIRARFDPHVGWIETRRPLSEMLENGLERTRDTTRWKRFKRFWSELWSQPFMPPPR